MLNKTIYKTLILLLGILILISTSCGPVHRFTRVQKIPRQYSLNYCGEDIKAPRSELNNEPWIVYSDRTKNESFNKAGGKVKAKDVDFLDPFLVIGKKGKGEYLKLIKYTPEILQNGKLDYKKAEYYGWMHKSKLLLYQQSVTDISSGKKNKTLTIFADSISINEPEKFFADDSIKLYKGLEFKIPASVLSPYSVVYQLKQSEDKSMSLIARKPYLQPDEVKNDVLGWIDNSLIKDIGTGLHVNLRTVPQAQKRFFIRKYEDITLTEDITDASRMLSDQYKTLKYTPVSSYSTKDSLVAFRTRMVMPVFDYSNNYIFNVNGSPISYKKFKNITKGLKRINISFVFDGGDQTIAQFPQIVNALQNLQPLFEQQDDNYSYQFNSVMTFDESGRILRPVSTAFTNDYTQIVNYLSDKANLKDKLRPIIAPRNSWPALRKSVELFDKYKDANNLIVLIGDKKVTSSGIDSVFVNRILKNNCRIIGFQVYAGEGDDYNNFVLEIEDMINHYADGMIKKKRDILVSPEQIKRMNYYKQVGEHKNSYRLDFPDNSITQGALFFPQKSETLPMEILTHNVDTMIQQIRQDNSSITQYMSRAFRSVGNNRTRFDSLFVQHYGIDTARIPQKKLIASFVNETPGWYMPSRIVLLDDSANNALAYRLMLSEAEMKELKEFVASLSEEEVDLVIEQKKAKQKRKPCNCPEDDLFAELERGEPQAGNDGAATDSVNTSILPEAGTYANTKKVRKHLVKVFLSPIKYCKLCKEKGKILNTLTLAEAQYRITGCPTSNQLLNSITIKELKDKKLVTDEELDNLVIYYKKMKKELDKAEQFESNSETYYWVDRKLLP
ncbi:type VI secretion system protein TssR domain-containing protein [Dysgonomonas sp. 511]|uniref:type VI secretion system protein TssR domain-containing protein n=1 Tax=Dysgonomonas sp. 511 TaxID=2302930 RepID=UPI0013D278AE|nr:type VI secretion system protein TssR domain-containing protein [Dysgonomonas sp. 511]NDV78476.1 hypothetical protein [Dysgonomonas sp. 511]